MLQSILLEITSTAWILAFTAAFVLGISKSGIKGIALIHVTFMALAYGAKESTGILLPLLVVGDIFAVIYYNRHTQWGYIARFLPWIIAGVVVGAFLGKDIPEHTFKICMAGVIFSSVALMFWWDQKKSKTVPTHWAFAGFMGLTAGVTTMVGNLAGIFSNIYFLAMRLPKNQFIGTAATLFLIVNVFKLPFHIFIWKTITPTTLLIDLKLLPALLIGLFAGIRLVKIIHEKHYRKMILALTAIGALLILFR